MNRTIVENMKNKIELKSRTLTSRVELKIFSKCRYYFYTGKKKYFFDSFENKNFSLSTIDLTKKLLLDF